MRKLFARERAAMRGVATVEFALVLIPLLMLAFGAVEYGRAMYQYDTLVKAARDGVRLLSQNNPSDDVYADREDEARCLVVYGNTGCTGAALVPGLSTGQVRICDRINFGNCPGATQADYLNVETGMGAINLVEVRIVGYEFDFLGLPFVADAASIVFDNIGAVMRQVI